MSIDTVVAIIAAAATIISVIITVISGNKKIAVKMEVAQAVTDTKLTSLEEAVKPLNSLSQRIPVIEEKQANFERRLEAVERRCK